MKKPKPWRWTKKRREKLADLLMQSAIDDAVKQAKASGWIAVRAEAEMTRNGIACHLDVKPSAETWEAWFEMTKKGWC